MTRTFEEIEADDGTRLRLWRRRADAGSAVLFVHGATYPGRSVFALDADPAGESWLAACARGGRAAYAIDLRGYGDSEAPPELDAPPAANEPVVRADAAADDVAAALATLLDRHERVHLVGYSWGSMVCGRLLASRAVEVVSLTQYAPVYAFPDGADDLPDDPDAYRVVTASEVRDRWDAQFPAGVSPSSRRDEGTVEAFWRSLRDSGQAADRDGAPAVRAPNGTLADMAAAATGTPAYDPAAIDAPALVVRGSFDASATRADALGLYDALGAADDEKAYAEVAGGTHFLNLERRRTALFDLVSGFQRRYE
ncbi:alpha/beta fold hydrolase [Halomarina halobia]|uniref:Alpha/beta fold hydrolase n=1 Tax=Halomarina halobia TaxID=3033386 RepID=A0ABD6AA16_9EURY|nr:alpha/beta hydrolase [Halomarina sp. PSR21]